MFLNTLIKNNTELTRKKNAIISSDHTVVELPHLQRGDQECELWDSVNLLLQDQLQSPTALLYNLISLWKKRKKGAQQENDSLQKQNELHCRGSFRRW